MATVTTTTKSVVKRGWAEIEPKLLAVAAGLASATALTALAKLFHYNLDPTVAVAAAGLLSLLVGYWKSSPAPTFPVAAAVSDVADVVKAAVPSIAAQVSEVQSVIAPAFTDASAVAPAPVATAPNGGNV